MESYLPVIAALIVCEVFESWWQHDVTAGRMLEKIRGVFHTDIFLLFLMHPSLWLVLYLYAERGFHGALLGMIVVMKASDLLFKLWMVQKIDRNEISAEFRAMLSMPLPPWMPWINVVLYPLLAVAALAPS